QIPENRKGEVAWMPPAAVPAANDIQKKETRRRVDEYFGRLNADVPSQLAQLHMGDMVTDFLGYHGDALTMMMQLAAKFLEPEVANRVVGGQGIQLPSDIKSIQGKYDMELTFDPRHLDMEHIVKLATMINGMILPMDSKATVQRDKMVSVLMRAVSPNMADETLQPIEAASQREIEDEQGLFAQIAAGIEPPMQVEGQNHALRLQTLMQIIEKNPVSVQQMAPPSQQILQARIQHFQHQIQQQQNAVIGATGAAPALAQRG
ncbi:hypothetical protein N9937_01545, partial [bacterium]|nr:hypothetical protein [bacterium]